MRGLTAFPDLPSQRSRYTSLGWTHCSAVDMNFIYNDFIPKDRIARYAVPCTPFPPPPTHTPPPRTERCCTASLVHVLTTCVCVLLFWLCHPPPTCLLAHRPTDLPPYLPTDTHSPARAERAELFDEFEEWYLMSAHYCMALAVNHGDGGIDLRPLLFSEVTGAAVSAPGSGISIASSASGMP